MKDRLPNSEQFERLIQAILAKPSGETYSLDDFMAALKTDIDAAKAIAPIGTEITVNGVTQGISTSQGNVNGASSAGVTGVSVNAATYSKKTGGQTGTNAFYYDGSSWRLGSQTGQWVNLTDYGITVQGTPVSGDYITVTVPTSSIVLRVAAYDHYEPANPNVKHTVAFETKDCIKDNQQFSSDSEFQIAVTKKEMPAGKYKFEIYNAFYVGGNSDLSGGSRPQANGTYVFTTTKAIPVGGGITFNYLGGWNGDGGDQAWAVQWCRPTTYGADRETVLESDIALTVYSASTDSDAADLGTLSNTYYEGKTYQSEFGFNNFAPRFKKYDNDWETSATRQWLNADKPAGAWYKWRSIFARKSDSGWTDQRDGFVYCLPPELKKYLCKVKVKREASNPVVSVMGACSASKPIAWNDDTDAAYGVEAGKNVVTTEDAVFIPSARELNLHSTWSMGEDSVNSPLELYADLAYSNAAEPMRIKTFNDEPTRYMTRTAWVYNPGKVTAVEPAGSDGSAGDCERAMGVAPIIVLG